LLSPVGINSGKGDGDKRTKKDSDTEDESDTETEEETGDESSEEQSDHTSTSDASSATETEGAEGTTTVTSDEEGSTTDDDDSTTDEDSKSGQKKYQSHANRIKGRSSDSAGILSRPRTTGKTKTELALITSRSGNRRRRRRQRPLTICMSHCRYELVRVTSQMYNLTEVSEDTAWNIYWTDYSVSLERAVEMRRFQVSQA
jgi:hypothetical protein